MRRIISVINSLDLYRLKFGGSNMAESPASSSTSDKPAVDLIPDTAPFDPITADQPGVEIQPSTSSHNARNDSTPEEMAAVNEEAELGNSIERELLHLTIVQAEMEAECQRLDAEKEGIDGDKKEEGGESVEDNEGEENAMETVKVDEEKSEKLAESVEGEDEDERKVEGESVTKLGKRNHGSNGRRINYPIRPDAEDCTYYMKFRTCKFGLNCKFNHPSRRKNQGVKDKAKPMEKNSEKDGQTECKYYLTPGGCRYGKDCKYSHGSAKSSTSHDPQFNFIGLPIRPGKKECPYYMCTGSCKYGSNCRLHHPNPKVVAEDGSPPKHDNAGPLPPQIMPSTSVSSWSSPKAFTDNSPFVPLMHPPIQSAPTPNSEWNSYQAAAYSTSERSLPTPPAFSINNLSTEINFPMQHRYAMVVEEYPERPGEPECSFLVKTGDCKFKSNCRFHHPKNQSSKTKANLFPLNDKGLPHRPDQPICSHYHRYGICKYGPACKYDHPSKFAILPPPFDVAENSVQGSETKSRI